MTNKYYVVTSLTQYRMRYVIPVEDLRDEDGKVDQEWAADTVTMNEAEEFSQLHIGDTIVDVQELDEEKVLELFDRDNEYQRGWTKEKKLETIRNWRFRG